MKGDNKRMPYISSIKRLEIFAKKFGSRNFCIAEVKDDKAFLQGELGFKNAKSFTAWINRMGKEGKVLRVGSGVYTLNQSIVIISSVPMVKVDTLVATKEPLSEPLMLSQSDYQLLSWLAERMEHLNGQSSRVADRSRPDWVSEEDWHDFVSNMLDWHILEVLEDNNGERTFVVDLVRCRDAFCLAKTFPPSHLLETLLYKHKHIQSRRELLTTELAEINAQMVKLEERRAILQKDLTETERKASTIDTYVNSEELQKVILELE